MKLNISLILLAAVSVLMLSIAFLRAKKTEHAPVNLPSQQQSKVGLKELSEPANSEPVEAVENDENTEATFSSDEKAAMIEAALKNDDTGTNADAAKFLHQMVEMGTASDVLAALPRATFFADSTTREIAHLQQSLCRFQQDEMAFEIIKYKFNLLFKNVVEIKPWQTICGAG